MAFPLLRKVFSVKERELSSASSNAPLQTGDDDAVLDRAYRKVDLRILLWYTIVLTVVRLEAHNIVNAAIMNVEAGTDIKHQLGNLTDVQWAMILGAFHYPFIVFEPISTLLLKHFTPRIWIGRIMLTWGIIAMCTGAAQNFGGLFACRVLLGLTEAGFLPSIIYHISFWYPADRLPFRVAILCALITLTGAFSGILSYAISFLNGNCGLAGWRWLFIIEGIPAVLCGIFTLIWLPNYPEDASMLTEPERTAMLGNRPKAQPSSTDRTWDWSQVKALFKDRTLYTFSLLWVTHIIGAFGIIMVLPTIIFDLGITGSAASQLMTIPPSIIGGGVLLLIAWAVQRKKFNSWLMAAILDICVLACYLALIFTPGAIIRYVLMILAMVCAIGVLPLLWVERIRATNGTTNAGLAIGITSAVGNLHGIVAPHVYLSRFGPTCRTSFAIAIGLVGVAILMIGITWGLVRRKGRRDQGHEEGEAKGEAKGETKGEGLEMAQEIEREKE